MIINGKQRDAGRFLFNHDSSHDDEMLDDFTKKLDDFFEWYSSFQNREPIKSVQLCSSDWICSNDCKFLVTNKFSVIDILISFKSMKNLLVECGTKYGIEIDLQDS